MAHVNEEFIYDNVTLSFRSSTKKRKVVERSAEAERDDASLEADHVRDKDDDNLQFHLEDNEITENSQYYLEAGKSPRTSVNPTLRGGNPDADTARVRSWKSRVRVVPRRSRNSSALKYCMDNLKGNCKRKENCNKLHVDVVRCESDRYAICRMFFCNSFPATCSPFRPCAKLHLFLEERLVFMEEGYLTNSVCMRNHDKVFSSEICYYHLKKMCIHSDRCHFRHVDVVESKGERIYISQFIFCYQYQKGNCTHPNCRLFHSCKENLDFFISHGYLDQSLLHVALRGVSSSNYEVSQDGLQGNAHPSSFEVPFFSAGQRKRKYPESSEGEVVQQLVKDNASLKQNVVQLKELLTNSCNCINIAIQLIANNVGIASNVETAYATN